MATPYDHIPDRRAIVRRRALEEALEALVEDLPAGGPGIEFIRHRPLRSDRSVREAFSHLEVVAPRLVDLFAALPAITGKVEMVFEGEQQGAEIVAKKLIGDAVKTLFETVAWAPGAL